MKENDIFSFDSDGEGYTGEDVMYPRNGEEISTTNSIFLPSSTTEDLSSALLTVLHQPDSNFLPFDDTTLIEDDIEWIPNSSAFPLETFPSFLENPKRNSPESLLSSSSTASSTKSANKPPETVKRKARTKRHAPLERQSSWVKSLMATDKPLQKRGPRVVGRKCQHCGSEKTPQWRAGPHGAKSLCNACGVRFKSGRLVPEYRPANSPTFCTNLHSNSHRKVVEMRRVKQTMGLSLAGPFPKVVD